MDPGPNVGSLLRLFKSQHFDLFMAVTYLYRNTQSRPIQDYICNELYQMKKDDIDYYLPQLCAFLATNTEASPGLSRFLLDRCASCLHFALKITWLFSALGDPNDPDLLQRCSKLRSEAELATYNGRRPGAFPSDILITQELPEYVLKANPDEDPMLLQAMSKIDRCNYFKATQEFSEGLATISDKLRFIPMEERNEHLRKQIIDMNAKLRNQPGIYIPLAFAEQTHRCIVRIPPSEAITLSSRDRAPFLIIVETLDTKGVTNADEHLHSMVKQYAKVFKEIDSKPFVLPSAPQEEDGLESDTESESDKWVMVSSPPTPRGQSGQNEPITSQSGAQSGQSAPVTPRGQSGQNESTTSQSRGQSEQNQPNETKQTELTPTQEKNQHEEKSQNEKPKSTDTKIKQAIKRKKSILYFRETWEKKAERIKIDSPFGYLPNWGLMSLIVKFGDDCRQERVALQLIGQFQRIFQEAKLPLYIKAYDILVLSPVSCLIETVTNAQSIHQMKKENNGISLITNAQSIHRMKKENDGISLSEYFSKMSGGKESYKYKALQCNFINSVAAYSLVTYLLQIKDRHNGNILITNDAHIVHIDFGFMLSNSPGGLNFETSPFKLPQEYIDFMGGIDGPMFQYFKVCMSTGFTELRKHSDKIIELVSMLIQTKAHMPCLYGGSSILQSLKERFFLGMSVLCFSLLSLLSFSSLPPSRGHTSKECEEHLDNLINISINNSRTTQYDQFQFFSNGIFH